MAAARAGNKDALQITLDADVDPDCRDASGNTLLLVAAHGGHTDCVMALLQAGANVGTTNLKGEGILHICFANGWTSLGTTVAAIQNESTYWTTLADEHGVDSEAVLAAMDLGLDLKIFESSRAPSRANTATKKLSSSARFLDCISNEIMSHDLASDTNHSSDRHRGGSNRLPQVPILQLSGHGGDSDSAKSRSGERPHPVPGLQLPTHGEIDATISIAERELALSALEARQAEAEMYTDAELGRGQGLPHASDTKKDKKKRGKLRIKHRNEDLEGASNSVPAQRSAHVSESILLIGKSQAAFESNHAKMTRAQQEATDLDREIQQQLDEGLLSAALNGDVKGIRSWLEKGALVDAKRADTGDTAMHIAASAGNKKMCKALLRECAVLDLKNVYGQTAPDVAFRKGHAELGGYLKSKENMQSEEQTEGGNHQDNSEYVFESHQVDQIVNNESVAHADADNMFEGLGGGEDVSGTIDSRHSSSKLQSTVQGDVKGMMRQLRLLGMTTYPQDFDRHSPGWGSGRYLEGSEYDVHDSTHALDPLSLAEDYDDGADYDVLKCAEEFLQTVSPVNGKGAFTGVVFVAFFFTLS